MDPSVLADLDEDLFGSWSPIGPGAGRSRSSPAVTPPTAASPIGVGASSSPPQPPVNAPMGVGTTQYLRQLADYRRTTGQKTIPRRIPNTPSPTVSTASNSRRGEGGRRRVLNQEEMQQQLEEILQQQQQTAAGRRIAGITTTNTITTTYRNGRRPTVTRNSTSVRN